MTCQIISEILKIADLSKTGLVDIVHLPQKEKSLSNHTLRFLTPPPPSGERKLQRILTGFNLDLLSFSHYIFD